MRTLKKTLCLVLCLAMMAGLCVFASADFKDQGKIENEEAVAVLTGIGVIQGDDKGNFNPEGTLTRAEATVIITKLLGAADIKATTDKFTDVKADYWGMPYIAYCVAEGVVAGMGDGTFAPNGKLTGYQWATMLLRAIGYEISGSTWQIDVAKLVKSLSLAKGMTFVGTEEISRQDAAQMALNALYAQTVHYEGGSKVTVGGVEIITDSTLVKETYTESGVVHPETLAHTYFPGLTKKTTSVTTDKFGRKGAIEYTYQAPGAKKAETIYKAFVGSAYSFVAESKITVTDTDALNTGLNKALGITDVDEKIAVDGSTTIKFNKDLLTGLQDILVGDEVEIYVDEDDATVVTEIVVARYAITKAEVASKAVPSGTNKGKYKVTLGAGEVFAAKDEYTDGAYYLVALNKTNEVLDTKVAETVIGTLTKYTSKGVYTINGETYTGIDIKANLGLEKLYVLDNAGQIGHVAEVPGKTETITDYAMVQKTNVKSTSPDWTTGASEKTAQVQVLQSNGELKVYDLPLTKATAAITSTSIVEGDWYFKIGKDYVEIGGDGDTIAELKNAVFTYKVNENAITFVSKLADYTGSETASAVTAKTANTQIKKSTVVVDGVIFNDKTVFILKTSAGKIVMKTGLAALESTTISHDYTAVVDVTKGSTSNVNVAKVVFATNDTFGAATVEDSKDFVYVDGTCTITKDEKGADVFTYTAVKNDGTTVELTGANASVAAGIYAYKGTAIGTKQSSAKGEVTLISGTTYRIDSSNYVTINAKTTVVTIDGELEKGAKVEYIVNSDNVVTLLFVTEAAK